MFKLKKGLFFSLKLFLFVSIILNFSTLYSKEISYQTSQGEFEFTSKKSFINDGKEYYLIEDLNAFLSGDLNNINIKQPGEFIEKKGGYVIYNAPAGIRLTNQGLIRDEAKKFIVAYNVQRKIFGVIIGDVLINVNDVSIAEELASDYKMKINSVFPNLNLIILTLEPTKSIISLVKEMNEDTRIKKAYLDIIEHQMMGQ